MSSDPFVGIRRPIGVWCCVWVVANVGDFCYSDAVYTWLLKTKIFIFLVVISAIGL